MRIAAGTHGSRLSGKLNPTQREAVEHGAAPLLVITGAGSGKTNTLAHRVAHLIMCGVDVHRILLLTFSRRAAQEMTRRAERIVANVFRRNGQSLIWSGTFHAIGARLIREHARSIGLDPSCTILDRERRRPNGPHASRSRILESARSFPAQGHLPRDLFAHREQLSTAR
jgi:superfamily I DNA/RNA helicase